VKQAWQDSDEIATLLSAWSDGNDSTRDRLLTILYDELRRRAPSPPLAAVDELQAQIVELRFFGGLSIAETAQELAISQSTAKREWQMARAWLWQRLQPAWADAKG
jgi:DNA-directed RNA polymerase specialized sigma24 family protein